MDTLFLSAEVLDNPKSHHKICWQHFLPSDLHLVGRLMPISGIISFYLISGWLYGEMNKLFNTWIIDRLM